MSSISLKDVGVSFPLYGGSARSLRNRLASGATGGRIGSDAKARTCVEALSNVTIEIEHGERIAIVGHNGAGKSTFLRVLAGIYPPQMGRLVVKGRVAPLFDLGLGMDPDATGYDNIRLRGLYLGLSRRDIQSRVEEIATFTELGAFLHMPMRTYSAGMQTRLSFAVSTSVHPEILLLDEGIGAGDSAFIEKANRRLNEFVQRAGILVLASHSAGLLARLCTRALLLEHGRIIKAGPLDEVVDFYEGQSAAARSDDEAAGPVARKSFSGVS